MEYIVSVIDRINWRKIRNMNSVIQKRNKFSHLHEILCFSFPEIITYAQKCFDVKML